MKTQKKHYINTVFGKFALEMNSRGLYAVRFPGRCQPPAQRPVLYSQRTGLCRVARYFLEYFENPMRALKLKLDLTGHTDFQRRIYRALLNVPAGKTVTYGDLAKRAGYPGAARAVGSAMRKNRLPLVIPCHRVVPSNGGLGGYSAGVKWKRFLLEAEKTKSTQTSF